MNRTARWTICCIFLLLGCSQESGDQPNSDGLNNTKTAQNQWDDHEPRDKLKVLPQKSLLKSPKQPSRDDLPGSQKSKAKANRKGPAKLAWGRLWADLPPNFHGTEALRGPPGKVGEIALSDCFHPEPRDQKGAGVCTYPLFIEAADFEQYAHQMAKRTYIEPSKYRLSKAQASDARLKVVRMDFIESTASKAELGYFAAHCILFVGHPDGTSILVEFVTIDGGDRNKALSLADETLKTLRSGPLSLDASKGHRHFYFARRKAEGSIKIELPEGYIIRLDEGVDSWGYDAKRPHGIGDDVPLFSMWMHNSMSGGTTSREFPHYTGKRSLNLFGRAVTFLTLQEDSIISLIFKESLPIFDLYITIRGRPGPELERLVTALESATLYFDESLQDPEDTSHTKIEEGCFFRVTDPNSPLNIRQSPSPGSKIITKLESGTKVAATEQKGSWLKLDSPSKGWAWAESVHKRCSTEPEISE